MKNNTNIKGAITNDVIDTLVTLMRNIIGDIAVNIILKKIDFEASGQDIVYTFVDSTTDILSRKASFAIFRQVGRELAESIMSKHDEKDWINALQNSLNDLGFAECIAQKEECSLISNCVFHEKLESNNLKPTEHSVCGVCWGFTEEFTCHMKNIKGIQWVSRNPDNSCQFDYLEK